MKLSTQPSHRILVNEPGLLLTQCLCCGEVELYYKSITVALNLTDLYALINRLDSLPTASRYVVGLLDVRDTHVQAGFQAVGLCLTAGEREHLLQGLNMACLRLDLDLLTKRQLPLN
jgi:hypothetical protein